MRGATNAMNTKSTMTSRLPQSPSSDPAWHQASFRAMNTDVYVCHYSQHRTLVDYAVRHFNRIEHSLSRFDPDSDLSRLNRCPHTHCQVELELYSALEFAFWAAHWTNGVFDPTILPALVQAGYDRSFELLPDPATYQWDRDGETCTAPQAAGNWPEAHAAAQTAVPSLPSNYRAVSLDRNRREVIRPPHVQIDLGGMGKGWAVDRGAEIMHASGPLLINAGGDLYAHGYPGGSRGWEIELVHPRHPERPLTRVWLANCALATSTIAKRRWRQDGHIKHHLIDPRAPAAHRAPASTDALSVTVIASRTVLADVLAKVALILGATAGLAYLENLPGVEGLIYTDDDRIVCTQGFAAFQSPDESSQTTRSATAPWPHHSAPHCSAPHHSAPHRAPGSAPAIGEIQNVAATLAD